jgi:hypothetical protein
MGFAFGGGYQFEIGTVRDGKGNSQWFISHGPVIGFNLSAGFSEKAIRPNLGQSFTVADYEGFSSGYSMGLLVGGIEYSGDRVNPKHKNTDWKLRGDTYNQLGFGVLMGVKFGASWSRTKTSFVFK